MRVTLRQLAEAAGVSVTTASRVLNNSDHAVSREARERVMQMATELGYRPNISARTLRMDRSHTVGVIAHDITPYFTPQIIRGIQDTLKPASYFAVIASFAGDASLQSEALDALMSRGVDGIIIVDSWLYSAIPDLQRARKPYAFCQRLFSRKIANSVIGDNRDGAEQVVAHLIRAGHRRIGLINGPSTYYIAEDRLKGYRSAHRAAGIPVDPDLIVRGNWDLENGYRSARALMNRPDRPTALFAANDEMAVGAIYGVRDAGLCVPEDVAVVGYDDQPLATQFRPQLTTVTYPCYEMGVEAARLLLKQMGGDHEPVEEISLKGQLIVRDSCGTRRSNALSVVGQP